MSDTHAIDHRAVLLPITTKVLQRPTYDNTHIEHEMHWCRDNAAALARYWHELANGQTVSTSGADFHLWLRCCYETEVIHAARRARLPHAGDTL